MSTTTTLLAWSSTSQTPGTRLGGAVVWLATEDLMGGPSYHVGADENGLGPRLGPMLVTAVLARVDEGAASVITRRPRGALAKRLGDSKGLVAHGDCALAEAWTRALVERGAGKHRSATSPAELLDAIGLDPHGELTAPCPPHVERQCWRTDGEAFAQDSDTSSMLRTIHRDLDRLAKRGVHIEAVRSVVVCTRRLNDAVDRGHSRFVVDLHAMERLVLELRERAGAEVQAVCGKVGGYGQYGKVFGPLAGRLHATVEEGRGRSEYRFPGLGNIAFVMDSDDSHMLVSLASLVGKYLRELLMARIVHHYRDIDPELPVVSGYHDPQTARFIVGTERLRRQAQVPARCFERDKIGS